MADGKKYSEDTALFTSQQPTYAGQSTPPVHRASAEDDGSIKEDGNENYQAQDDSSQRQSRGSIPREDIHGDSDTDEQRKADDFDELLGQVHERAIDEAGFGRLQWIMMVFLGFGLMGDGVELLLMAYILPGAEQDLCMNGQMKGWLGAIAFAGMIVGAMLWGNLSDRLGRKITLLTSLSFNALFSILGAFMPDYPMFFLCRFLAGVGIGGSIPIVLAYFSEFCPRTKRGFHVTLILSFWVLGGVYVSILGWLIVPRQELLSGQWAHQSWRVFMLACSLPVLIAICGICSMPESPRYLLQVGRDLEALTVYRRLYKWNHSEAGAEYEMPEIELPSHTVTRAVDNPVQRPSRFDRCHSAISEFLNSFWSLFMPPLTATTFVLGALWLSISFGYYGMSIWFPEYLKKLQEEVYFSQTNVTSNQIIQDTSFTNLLDNVHYVNVSFHNVTFHDIEIRHVIFDRSKFDNCLFGNVTAKKSYFEHSTITNTVFNRTNIYADKFIQSNLVNSSVAGIPVGCTVDFDINYSDNKVYLENLLSQLAVIPAQIINAVLIDRIGRVKILASCLLLSAASVFLIWFTNTEIAVVCVNAAFNCAINGAFNSIDVATTELFPTKLRSTGFGFLSCLGRAAAIMGNVAFGNLIEISKAIPILLVAVILSLGAMCSLKLPESKDKKL